MSKHGIRSDHFFSIKYEGPDFVPFLVDFISLCSDLSSRVFLHWKWSLFQLHLDHLRWNSPCWLWNYNIDLLLQEGMSLVSLLWQSMRRKRLRLFFFLKITALRQCHRVGSRLAWEKIGNYISVHEPSCSRCFATF